MSKKIDERVVEMRFDNKQFESGVSETMSTLDKLKQKLQLKDATKGMDDIEKSAKKVDLSPLGKVAEQVSLKFSALQVAGITALTNITNSAVNAGKNIAKAFTIDPIMTGFQEYETQINAVQTILANTESKGSTLQDVNAALNELNTYADMTIYNFTEMTRNIGTFTAAGVDLKTSVSAIKGIANLAAVSGSTSLQASTAMYQLSQALAAGKVSLMDWNSVVNAGMGGQVFQDALMETARVHGVAIDAMIKKRGSFRETLQDGWLTAEVLTETLSKFTGDLSEDQLKQMGYTDEQIEKIIKMGNTANDAATKVKTFSQLLDTLKEAAQSGWTMSWQTIIGDFEEAKDFLTDVSDRLSEIIGKSADARNEMLSGGLSSGWKQLLNAGIADEEGYKEVFKNVAKEQGTSIDDMIAAQKELDESISDTEAFQKALKQGFSDGTISADMLTESVHKMAEKMGGMSAREMEAAGYTAKHVEQIKALSDGLKDGSVSMDEFAKKITRTSGRENLIQALWNSFDGLMNIITPITEAFREIFPRTTGDQLYDITIKIENITAKFKELTEKNAPQLKATFKGIFSVISVGVNIVKAIIGGITTLIGKLTGFSGGILDITGAMGDWLSKMSDGINEANLFGKAIDGITGFLGGAIDALKEFAGAVKEKVTANGFEWFFELMQKIGDVIKRVSKAVGTVAVAIGKALGNAFSNGDFKSLLDILNGGLFASILLGINKIVKKLKGVKGSDVTKSLFGTITEIPGKIKDVLGSVEESLQSWQKNLQSVTIKNIAIAIGILAASLWVLSGIDSDKMGTALGGIGVLMGELMGAMFLFTKITADAKSALKGIPALIGIAVAILILASALKKLSDLNWDELKVGLTGIAGLVAIAAGAMIALSKFTSKLDKFSEVSKNGIFKSESKKNLISVGLAMIAMAAAVKILASACKDLSGLNWNEIGVGLTGIVILLGSATGAMIALSKFTSVSSKASKDGALNSKSQQSLITIGLAMIAMAAAMKVLASACKDLSGLNWDELKVGLTGIVVMLGVVTGAMIALSRFTSKTGEIFNQSEKGMFSSKSKQNLISIGLSMIAIAAAMKIMASAAADFAEMEWPDLGKAGAAITAILGLTTGFLLLAGKAKNMKQTVGSLLIIAATMEIFAHVAGVFGNMEWPDLGKAGAAITGILGLVLAFSALAGKVKGDMMASATALLVVAAALLVLTPVLKTLGSMSFGQIITGLVAIAGALAIFIGAAALISKFKLDSALYSLAGSIALIGLACLAAGAGIMMFAAGFTALAAAGAAGATSYVAAITIIIIGILNLIPSIVDQITAAIVAICNVIIQSAPAIGKALKELVLLAIDIMVECIPQLAEGILQLIVKVMTLLVQYTPQILDLLIDFILAVINGLAARLPEYMAAVANLIITFINGLAEYMPQFIAAGVNLIAAIIQGIADALGPILEVLTGVITEIIDSVAKALPGLADVISAAGETIRNALSGIADVFDSVFGGIADVITSVGDTIKKVLDGIAGIIESIGEAALNAGTGFENLANGVKTITDLKLADMAASLAAVAVGVGKITKHSKGLAEAGTGMKNLANGVEVSASAFDKMAAGVSAVSSSFTKLTSITTTVTSTISSIVTIVRNAESQITAAIKSVLSASVKSVEGYSANYKSAAKYLVEGFAQGITDNTFQAEAKAKTMAKKALVAAKKELDEHSPSKKFAKLGMFAVQGLANGITKNVGTSNKASVKMANGVLTSFQEELGIHSPSLVFNEQGRYIVQGIADGITKDMSAEEAIEKKAQNIVNAFQDELDKYDRGISNRGKDFDLWQLEDGKIASTVEILQKQKQNLNADLTDYNKQVQLNTDKWQQLKDTFGENNKATQEAYGAMRDSQITAAQIAADYINIDKSIIEAQEESLDGWKTMNENDLEIMELERANGKIYSDKFVDNQYLNTYKDNLNIAKTKENNAKKYFEDMLAKYGDRNHPEVQAAIKAWQDSKKERLEAVAAINDYEDSITDRELQALEDSRYHRQDVLDRWEAKYGDDASDYQRKLFYTNTYTSELDDLNKEYRIRNNEYEALVKRIAEENGISIAEAKTIKEAVDFNNNVLYPLETEKIETQNKIDDVNKDYLENQKETLKDQYETASDIADTKYQIWELTAGRDATNAEKETMKLAVLTEQLGNQAKLVNMAKDAWENAKEDEKLEKEQEYWQAQLQLAQLQSDVLDIQEANTKRQKSALDKQRLAQDEYEDYVKQYKKYYLDHGMSLEDLERDAKLVSGYDPDKVTTSAVNKTQSAIDNISTNVTNLTKAIGEGIQNGITDVTANTTSMLDSCAEVLSAEKDTWFKAGASMVDGLTEGITSKVQTAVDTVTDLVTRMLEAMQYTIENGMNLSSGVTPVYDMASGWNTKVVYSGMRSSDMTSLNLAKSIAQNKANIVSVTPDTTQSSAPVYSFTQNNYSPKAISASESYRLNNNLISRVVGTRLTQ